MSGVAVLLHRDGRPADAASVAQVAAMLDAIPYRGPDGTGVHRDGPVVLGHAAFAVTPEDVLERRTGGQPLVNPRSGCAIVADARLDNRAALRAALMARGPALPLPTLVGDATLILCAYENWGQDAFARLLGDFAVVIWDAHHRRVICARDTSGQRSLFYRSDARTFAAASEIHQLLQDHAISVWPNEDRIRDSLVPVNVFRNEQDQAATYYKDIWALPAGHVLTVEGERIRSTRYWQLEVPREIRYRRAQEYAEHFSSLFSEVVQSRLRAAHPMGALLSGGLDSSSVVCTAQQLYRRGVATDRGFTSFSTVFDSLDCDERDLIGEMQMAYGFDARFVSGGAFGGRLQLEPDGFMECPNMGIPEARDTLFATIQASGVRAVLTGDVADSCIGGSWEVFDSLLRGRRLRDFVRYWRAYHGHEGVSARRTLLFGCVLPFVPLGLQRRAMLVHIRRSFRRSRARLLPNWMPPTSRAALADRHLALMLEAEGGRRFARAAHEAEYRALYPPEAARHPVPWSVEIWRPFADRRLHEFLLAVPPEEKFAPIEGESFYAGSKRVLRTAMRGVVPESIRARRVKTVFTAVLRTEVQRQWPLYELAFGPNARPEVARRGYVDQPAFWQRLLELKDGTDAPDFAYVMNMAALETWLRTLTLPRSRLSVVRSPWHTPPPVTLDTEGDWRAHSASADTRLNETALSGV
jgi:asparagine synthase (glutamine-hydrolysing)